MSTAGDTDSVFGDAECELEEPRKRKRERQQSITELITAYEKRQKKGKSPKGKSPKGKSPTGKAALSVDMLSCIKDIIEATIESKMDEHLSQIKSALKIRTSPSRRGSKFW